MFGIARWVVRHKVGATAIFALGIFFLSSGEEPEPVATNPWGVQPAQAASTEEPGVVDAAIDGAVDYLDEAGLNPVSQADESVQRLDDTATAFQQVNAEN